MRYTVYAGALMCRQLFEKFLCAFVLVCVRTCVRACCLREATVSWRAVSGLAVLVFLPGEGAKSWQGSGWGREVVKRGRGVAARRQWKLFHVHPAWRCRGQLDSTLRCGRPTWELAHLSLPIPPLSTYLPVFSKSSPPSSSSPLFHFTALNPKFTSLQISTGFFYISHPSLMSTCHVMSCFFFVFVFFWYSNCSTQLLILIPTANPPNSPTPSTHPNFCELPHWELLSVRRNPTFLVHSDCLGLWTVPQAANPAALLLLPPLPLVHLLVPRSPDKTEDESCQRAGDLAR